MLILNAAEVCQALPMTEAIEAMKQAFAAFSDKRAIVPQRVQLASERNSGISLFMPALIDYPDSRAQALTVKVASVFERNPERGIDRVQAAVLVLEPDTGRVLALLEGATLTSLRTAAASGAATDLLARPDARRVAILGGGVEARTHLEAMCAVRPVETARIFSRTPSKVAALIDEFSSRPGWKTELIAAASVREAMAQADIVCATTSARTPIFNDADLPAGVHINAVGSYTPETREIPSATVARALVVVDSREAAWAEAGDLIQPFEAGVITRKHVRAELGELILGRFEGRTDPAQVTIFKSVGLAVQDAVAAQWVLRNARRYGLGTEVSF
ncbi:MAG: ornithine cyclodeaminase family protein [Planctomycetales bacterium]